MNAISRMSNHTAATAMIIRRHTMKRNIFILTALMMALTLFAGHAQSQILSLSKDGKSDFANGSLTARAEFRFLEPPPSPTNPFARRGSPGAKLILTTATMAGFPNITGTGTPGKIPVFTAGTEIRDSMIFQSKHGNIGIGTTTPGSKLSVGGVIESLSGGIKFPDGTMQTTAGIANVIHDASLTRMGTAGSPLGIAPQGVNTEHLANGAVTASKIANGAVGTAQLADSAVTTTKLANAAVTASKISDNTVVRSLNGLRENVTLAQGSGITITPSGNTLTLATTGVLTSVAHDSTLKGNGTSASPLGVNAPLSLGATISDSAVIAATNNSTASSAIGLFGTTASNGTGVGVWGVGGDNSIPPGEIRGTAVRGTGNIGVDGVGSGQFSIGIRGRTGSGVLAGFFQGSVNIGDNLTIFDDLKVMGDKDFVEPHPTDPNLMIAYVALEGPEAGTYFRGSGRIVNGIATIEVPEDFRMVTDEKGITVQVTPMGEPATIWCVRKSLDTIELRGSADVEFDFMVNGVRKMTKGRKPIRENTVFLPITPDDDTLTRIKNPEAIRRLKASGILNEDGSVNMVTVQDLEAYKRAHQQQ